MIDIIPAGASAVVTDSGRCQNGDEFRNVMNAISNARQDAAKGFNDTETRLNTAVTDAGYRAVNATTDAGTQLAKDICGSTAAGVGATVAAQRDVSSQLSLAAAAHAEAYRNMTLQVCSTSDDVSKQLGSAYASIQVGQVGGFKDAQATAYQLAGSAALTAATNQSATALAVQLAQTASALAFKDSAILAQQLAATAAAQAAECCCELKTAILSDGQKTRELINANETQNLRDRAQRTDAALAAFFAAKVAPTSPVA